MTDASSRYGEKDMSQHLKQPQIVTPKPLRKLFARGFGSCGNAINSNRKHAWAADFCVSKLVIPAQAEPSHRVSARRRLRFAQESRESRRQEVTDDQATCTLVLLASCDWGGRCGRTIIPGWRSQRCGPSESDRTTSRWCEGLSDTMRAAVLTCCPSITKG